MLQTRRPIKSVPTNGCHLDLLGRTLKEGQYVAEGETVNYKIIRDGKEMLLPIKVKYAKQKKYS